MEELYKIYLANPNIVIDTRSPLPDSIFFALRGPNFNANEYAEKALNSGSNYAVIDDVKFKKDERYILVKDVLTTLQELANFHRQKLTIPILALTGTNGKTTTKELMAIVLSEKYNIAFTKGNLNNHIGVPLTLLSIRKEHEIAIVEMGANKPGDIKELCEIAEPDFGLITNIGKAHLEGFGSYEGVIKTKSEMYDFIQSKNRKIFLNIDNELLVKKAQGIDFISYGIHSGDTHTSAIEVSPFLSVSLVNLDGEFKVYTKLIGSYNAENIVAAARIGSYFGLKNEEIKRGLENYIPANNRSQVDQRKNYTLLMDAYNANPSSMQVALENFAVIKNDSKYFILGDMFELGNISEEEHLNIIQLAKKLKLNGIFIGKLFAKHKNENFKFFENSDEAKSQIKNYIPEKSLILIKGSRGMRLESLAELFD